MTQKTMDRLIDAILPNVMFDGWSKTSFDMAVQDAGVDPVVAKGLCPNGAIDLAAAFHRRGDVMMRRDFAQADTDDLKIREKVRLAVQLRLENISDKDAVRRAMSVFALPQNAMLGSRLLWGTADAIWDCLGDTSSDGNWYTKRAMLSGVYGSTVLFWLGDTSANHEDTWSFLDRRIENVMQVEKAKRSKPFDRLAGLLGSIKAPNPNSRPNMPGRWGS